MNRLFTLDGKRIGVSASTSVLPVDIELISFRIDWSDFRGVQGTLKSLVQQHSSKTNSSCPAFFMVQLEHFYMTTGKTIALTNVFSKVMSLFFNILSRFVIAFLPRSKCLLISWLQ